MTTFQVIPARAHHCGMMARRLRVDHFLAMARAGLDPHHELRDRFYDSLFCRSWLIDGQIEAMGGVSGPNVAAIGYVWLALSEKAMAYPLAVVREAQRQLDDLMVTKRQLVTMLLNGDDTARRFAVFLGFVPSSGEPGMTGYTRAGRRHVAKFLADMPDIRIPMGNSFAVPVSYTGDFA
jgi:hypothetical protein